MVRNEAQWLVADVMTFVSCTCLPRLLEQVHLNDEVRNLKELFRWIA